MPSSAIITLLEIKPIGKGDEHYLNSASERFDTSTRTSGTWPAKTSQQRKAEHPQKCCLLSNLEQGPRGLSASHARIPKDHHDARAGVAVAKHRPKFEEDLCCVGRQHRQVEFLIGRRKNACTESERWIPDH